MGVLTHWLISWLGTRRSRDAEAGALDLRRLPPPEPFERAWAAAEHLAPSTALVVLTPYVPTPLIDMLERRGYRCEVSLLVHGGARVAIQAPQDTAHSASAPE